MAAKLRHVYTQGGKKKEEEHICIYMKGKKSNVYFLEGVYAPHIRPFELTAETSKKSFLSPLSESVNLSFKTALEQKIK